MSHKPIINSPWAILLCRWHDDIAPDAKPRPFFDRLFTSMGRGTNNLVDYFDDITHRHIDISGSKVFGWLTLAQNRADYNGSGINSQGRLDLLDWARDAAVANGIDLSQFFGIVVCMNATPQLGTDLFGFPKGVCCDTNTIDGTILAHEMLHGYGLDHSRENGSLADYRDPWDMMSAWNVYSIEPHSEYIRIGPGLNAANMAAHDILDEARVWNSGARSFDITIQLRPLVRHDLPGFLAARVDDYIVEFRNKDGWDAAIPRAAVFVHRFEDNQSYLMPSTIGEYDLVADGVFTDPATTPLSPLVPFTSVKVIEIDSKRQIATIQLAHRANRFDENVGPGIVFGGVPAGGDGFVFLNGKIIRIPPRSPLAPILEQAVVYESTGGIESVELRKAVRRNALATIAAISEQQLRSTQDYCQPLPPAKREWIR